MIPKFLRDIDILGVKFHFYSGKTLKKSTAFGGILTILLGVFSMLLFIIFGHNFFYRKNPSVTMSVENDLKYEFIDLKKENIFFAFRIEDYDGNFINVTNILYFKIYYYKTEEDENGIFRSKINDEYLSYHICNEDDYSDINLAKIMESYIVLKKKNLLVIGIVLIYIILKFKFFFVKMEQNIQLIILNVLP